MPEKTKETKSAGGIVVNSDGLIAMVNQPNGAWTFPKGHIDEDESILDAAKREVYEESGINQLELVEDLGSYQRYQMGRDRLDDMSELKTIHFFLFKTNQSTIGPIDPENPEARWVKLDDIANRLSHKKDREFFLSVLDKIGKILK